MRPGGVKRRDGLLARRPALAHHAEADPRDWPGLGFGVLATALATGAGFVIDLWPPVASISAAYLLAVMVVALRAGLRPAILASLASLVRTRVQARRESARRTGYPSEDELDDKSGAADWVWCHGKPAGRGRPHCPGGAVTVLAAENRAGSGGSSGRADDGRRRPAQRRADAAVGDLGRSGGGGDRTHGPGRRYRSGASGLRTRMVALGLAVVVVARSQDAAGFHHGLGHQSDQR